jgi:hypothetical protein
VAKQQRRGLGLSAVEHRRTSNVLERVILGLRDVTRSLQGSYAKSHSTQRACAESIERVQSLRLEMENTARAEHPSENLVYLTEPAPIDLHSLSHAMATSGENLEID